MSIDNSVEKLVRKWKTGKIIELKYRFHSWTGAFSMQSVGFVWPTVVVFRKVFLLFTSRFITDPVDQYIVTTLVLCLSYGVLKWLHPYRFKSLNNLEELKLGLLLATIGVGAILYAAAELWEDHSSDNLDMFLTILVLLFQILGLIILIVATVLIVPRLFKFVRQVLIPKIKGVFTSIVNAFKNTYKKCRKFLRKKPRERRNTEENLEPVVRLTVNPLHARMASKSPNIDNESSLSAKTRSGENSLNRKPHNMQELSEASEEDPCRLSR